MDTRTLIARLKELNAVKDAGFKSQPACISWANDAAPLLAFNKDFHSAFLEKAAYINTIGLSANLQGTALNFMASILQQAIGALENASNGSQSRIDPLTELLDRGAFDVQILNEIKSAANRREPLALIFVDVDHFKKINDTQGHQKGDLVLTAVGRTLKNVVRGKGSAYRYGGEEMIVLLPNYTLNEAISVAERCRLAIEAARPSGITVTASLGVSVYPELARTSEDLIETADKAMYDAKNRGRNLVRFHAEPEPSPRVAVREPERKQPEGGRLTSTQRATLRKDHFQGTRIVCPDDQTPLRTREFSLLGSATPQLMISCPLCGFNEMI
ncbi:MAG TPA: GGDEF domain-containing protein [Candidatus Binatia bacterium]|nr:GGDEF domain-containing protein [Candidatus Binatia bacterium]